MKIIFCSSIYIDEKRAIEICKTMPSFSSHRLIKNLIKGIDENGYTCHVINIENLPSFPRCKELVHFGSGWNHTEITNSLEEDYDIGYIDIPFIKLIIQSYRLIQKIDQYIEKHRNEKICIIEYGRDFPFVVGINKIKKKYPNVVTCAILGDLNGKYAGEITSHKSYNPRIILADCLLNWQMKKIISFDCFVLVTKYMADALQLTKPFCVIEGVGCADSFNEPKDIGKKRVITYAGALEFQYNIRGVIKAFSLIDNPEFELCFFGDGPAKDFIVDASKKDPRIKYYGVVSPREIQEAYDKSTVLLNPRQNTAEYTKYTFPSKTMESLSSGRPLVGYKLDGIPDEYDSHICYVPDNSIISLRNSIVEICEKTLLERRKFAYSAWEFIVNEKSAVPQSKKLISFIEDQFG